MTIYKQSILSLTTQQASLFHGMVLEYLHNNVVDVLLLYPANNNGS